MTRVDEELANRIRNVEEEHARVYRELREIPFEEDEYGEVVGIARHAKRRAKKLSDELKSLNETLGVLYRS